MVLFGSSALHMGNEYTWRERKEKRVGGADTEVLYMSAINSKPVFGSGRSQTIQ